MPRNPSLDATPTSIERPKARNAWVGALKALILIAALIWVGKMVVDSVNAVQRGDLALTVRPGWLILSGVIVFANYCLLIASWLYILAGLSGSRIPFLVGARIWFVSQLSQLLPGRVWGIIQMGAMSAEQGINPVAAGAASIIATVVNIACGLAVGAIAGSGILASALGRDAWLAWALAAAAVIGILMLPLIVPWTFAFAKRRFDVSVPEAGMHARLIAVAAIANLASWILYGAAFLCLTRGMLDLPSHSLVQHTAAYASSYVIGYLAIIVPGGLAVREQTLETVLTAAGMANPAQATAAAIVSRIWLLIILVLPALIFLAYRRPPNEKNAAAG